MSLAENVFFSLVKGFSLYTHIHEKKTMFELYFKLSIAIQIAQVASLLYDSKETKTSLRLVTFILS